MRTPFQIEKEIVKADWAYVIGRFQLPHNGHFSLIRKGLEHAHRVLVIIGSDDCARSAMNPFSSHERKSMLTAGLSSDELSRVSFTAVPDLWCNGRWAASVHSKVNEFRASDETAVLVGHFKDYSSSYLKLLNLRLIDPGLQVDISSTALRDIYFTMDASPAALEVLRTQTASDVVDYLRAFSMLPAYQWLARDYKATVAYKKKWTAPAYLTGDAVVLCNQRVLLIQRGGDIGHGQWALPGGFMEPTESLFETAVRELYEETSISIPRGLLQEYHAGDKVFSHPRRSSRGRLVTNAHLFKLPPYEELPEVAPADDALSCAWIPLTQLPELRSEMFEDHFHVIDSLCNFPAQN